MYNGLHGLRASFKIDITDLHLKVRINNKIFDINIITQIFTKICSNKAILFIDRQFVTNSNHNRFYYSTKSAFNRELERL